MPALGGEPWRGLAVTRLADNVSGDQRAASVSIVDVNPLSTNGDQSDWERESDTVAVTLRAEWDGGGAGAPAVIDQIQVQVRLPGGAAVGSTWTISAPANPSGVATRTLHFDTDPLNETLGAATDRRWGALELYVRIINNTAAAPLQYDVDSRGAAPVQPAATTHNFARGYIRQRALLSTHSISNVSVGGAEPNPWAFPDPIHTRISTLRTPYESVSSTISLLRTPAGATERTQTAASTTTNHDRSWTATAGSSTSRVGEGIQAASEGKDLRVAFAAADFGGDDKFAWASTGHQAGWAKDSDLQLTNTNRITIDPHLTATIHFQVDDLTFELDNDVPSRQMRSEQSGFIWARARNSRNEGQNSLTILLTLDPQNPGSNVTHSASTTTLDSEAGWMATPLEWVVSKPGGLWDLTADITAPSDIDSDSYYLSNTDQFSLLVRDANIDVFVQGGNPLLPGRHWVPGQLLVVGGAVFSSEDNTLRTTDDATAEMVIVRNHPSFGAQYLDSAFAWQNLIDGFGAPVSADVHTLTEAAPGARLYTLTILGASTTTWETYDISLLFTGLVDGFPYIGMGFIPVLDDDNHHDGYVFDGPGFVGFPKK